VDTGDRSEKGNIVYQAEITGTFEGTEILRSTVYAVLSEGLFIGKPDGLVRGVQ
jgi:hypothetical protein